MLRSLVVLVVAVPLLAAPVPKAVKAKAFDLDGKWDTVERVALGSDVTATQPMIWEVKGAVLVMYDRHQDGTLTLAAAPNATVSLSPPDGAAADELDFLYVEGDSRKLYKGRTRWDGEDLLVSFGEPGADRPTEAKATASVYHYRLKRVKAK